MSGATSKESFPQKSSIKCTVLLSISMTYSTNKASSDSALWFNITGDVLPTIYHLTKKNSTSVAKRDVPAFGLRLVVLG